LAEVSSDTLLPYAHGHIAALYLLRRMHA